MCCCAFVVSHPVLSRSEWMVTQCVFIYQVRLAHCVVWTLYLKPARFWSCLSKFYLLVYLPRFLQSRRRVLLPQVGSCRSSMFAPVNVPSVCWVTGSHSSEPPTVTTHLWHTRTNRHTHTRCHIWAWWGFFSVAQPGDHRRDHLWQRAAQTQSTAGWWWRDSSCCQC